jgi:hypothetical protein
MAIDFKYPNSCATIFKNISGAPLRALSYLSVNFFPDEVVAIIGDPFICPNVPQSWDAKQKIINLSNAINKGELEVLSRQSNPDMSILFFYEQAPPVADEESEDYGKIIPDEANGLLGLNDPRIGKPRPGYRIEHSNS